MSSKNEVKRYYKLNEKLPDIEKIDGQFFDKDFPNDDNSLFYYDKSSKYAFNLELKLKKFEQKVRKFGEKVKWKRIFGENDKPSEFNLIEEDNTNDNREIIQGSIGDCYIISYLYCLEKFAPNIFSSIIRKSIPNKGYFEINFFIKEGDKIEPIIVIIDDYIPCYKFRNMDYYRPIFANYRVHENHPKFYFWKKELLKYGVGIFLLIEKAYAKLNGSYLNIIGGSDEKEPFIPFTGHDYKKIFIHEEYLSKYTYSEKIKDEFKKRIYQNTERTLKEITEENKNNIFKELKKIIDENLVTAGTQSYDGLNSFGIFGHHRYCIKNYETYMNKNFFALWNPHGKNPAIKKPVVVASKKGFFYYFNEIKSWFADKFNKIFNKKSYIIDNYYLYYDGCDKINKKNISGIETGEIFLSLEHFFMSFERIYCQNKNELKEKFEKRENIFENFLKQFPYPTYLLFFVYRKMDISLFIALITLLNSNAQKKENNYNFEENLMKIVEEKKENIIQISDDNENSQLSLEEDNNNNNNNLSNWKNIKEEIIKESNSIVKEKSKKYLGSRDLKEIKKILYDHYMETNKYYKMLLKYKKEVSNEYFNEIKLEIENICDEVANEYIKKN